MSRDDVPIGFAWLTQTADNVVELHACAEPAQCGRLLNKQVLSEFKGMMLDCGSDHVVAFHTDPVYRRLLDKLGFTRVGTFAHTINLRETQWDS